MSDRIKEKLVKLLEIKSQNDKTLLELNAEARIIRKKLNLNY
jgi:hypothetical protein